MGKDKGLRCSNRKGTEDMGGEDLRERAEEMGGKHEG